MTMAGGSSSASKSGISSAYVEPMIASPPIDTAVDWPRPAAVSVDLISVVLPPEREITPTGPGEEALAASLVGPPMPALLLAAGTLIPPHVGPRVQPPR